nr:nose resistant to fluoxetine protein 6-like [Ciona intestinalis]|eukprot:XP_026692261.1 nose resistant to fluoxetine protein 6-like [Ciona intestinalis]
MNLLLSEERFRIVIIIGAAFFVGASAHAEKQLSFPNEGYDPVLDVAKIGRAVEKAGHADWKLDLADILHGVHQHKQADDGGLHSVIKKMLDQIAKYDEEVQQCLCQWRIVLEDATNVSSNGVYALQMLDSWAIPESGILEGNIRWAGHYYECWKSRGPYVSGKWCNTYMGKQRPVEHPGIPLAMSWGSCFPISCTDTAVATIIEELTSMVILPEIIETSCPLPITRIDTIDIIAMVICCLFLVLVIVGTAYEFYTNNSVQSVRYQDHSTNKPHRKQQAITIWKVLSCFSMISNAKLLTSMKVKEGTLPLLDGLRALSTTWVIVAHVLYIPMNAIDNPVYSNDYYKAHGEVQALSNGTFSVDSFFFLSGLLVAYLGIKHLSNSNGKINIPLMYSQRYLRLTPVYAFLLLFSMSLYKFFGYGPYWNDLASVMYNSCKDVWFANLLYFNNLYPVEAQQCFGWSWYLANDMQFYLLSPFILILLYRSKTFGFLVMMVLLIGSTLITGVLSKETNLQPTPIGVNLYMSIFGRFMVNTSAEVTYADRYKTDTYTTPWCRIGVYVIGMMTDNPVYSNDYYKAHGEVQALSNGTFSVDSFFFLSGLLVAYLGIKHLNNSNGKINIPLMYLQRYLRLTPVYAFLLLFSMSLYKFFGYGPYWNDLASVMYNSCKDVWFANLLYFNNLYPAEAQSCLVHISIVEDMLQLI